MIYQSINNLSLLIIQELMKVLLVFDDFVYLIFFFYGTIQWDVTRYFG